MENLKRDQLHLEHQQASNIVLKMQSVLYIVGLFFTCKVGPLAHYIIIFLSLKNCLNLIIRQEWAFGAEVQNSEICTFFFFFLT